mmetsp:Transcript_8172/g.29726  ORF Transcript_8172/g.29726 Transcript_8172/m.29726 type:complete len:232 (+) Transcript_8172:848-1543(+)
MLLPQRAQLLLGEVVASGLLRGQAGVVEALVLVGILAHREHLLRVDQAFRLLRRLRLFSFVFLLGGSHALPDGRIPLGQRHQLVDDPVLDAFEAALVETFEDVDEFFVPAALGVDELGRHLLQLVEEDGASNVSGDLSDDHFQRLLGFHRDWSKVLNVRGIIHQSVRLKDLAAGFVEDPLEVFVLLLLEFLPDFLRDVELLPQLALRLLVQGLAVRVCLRKPFVVEVRVLI